MSERAAYVDVLKSRSIAVVGLVEIGNERLSEFLGHFSLYTHFCWICGLLFGTRRVVEFLGLGDSSAKEWLAVMGNGKWKWEEGSCAHHSVFLTEMSPREMNENKSPVREPGVTRKHETRI